MRPKKKVYVVRRRRFGRSHFPLAASRQIAGLRGGLKGNAHPFGIFSPPGVAPATPGEGAPKNFSGQVPLQIGRHAANTQFPYPFLGMVQAYAKSERIRVRTKAGDLAEMPLKVYYADNGNFIRAEFVKPGAKDFQTPLEDMEDALRGAEETVVGLPAKPMAVSLETILDHLQMPLENATRFNVTYVLYQQSENPPEPMILVNVFGLPSIVTDRLGDEEGLRRVRVVMD